MTSSVLRIRRWKRSRSRAISSQTPLRQACRAKAHVCMIWTWITGEKCTFLDRGLTSRFNIGVVVHVCLVIRCESCGSLHHVWFFFFLLLVWSVFKFTDPSIFCMKIWNCYYVSHWPSHSKWQTLIILLKRRHAHSREASPGVQPSSCMLCLCVWKKTLYDTKCFISSRPSV